jgi:hypothetical protein
MRTFLSLACLAATAAVAHAQDVKFTGNCKAYATMEACNATVYCKWSDPTKSGSAKPPVVLPNGVTLNRTAQCRFLPGRKAGWAANPQ